MPKIGVFVCHCGSNIAGTVDVEKVAAAARTIPGVVVACDYRYMCSEAGQGDDHKSHSGVTAWMGWWYAPVHPVCTKPRSAGRRSGKGSNPYMVEIANIREQCSWIHKNREEATDKAIVLMRAAVAKVKRDTPLTAGRSGVTRRALVIGGGIAGLSTALDVANAGYEVDIVEKEPTIGGKMAQLDKTFPTLDCSACILTPKMVEAAQNENIHLYTYSEVEKVSGYVGNFTVTIRKKARFVRGRPLHRVRSVHGKMPQPQSEK